MTKFKIVPLAAVLAMGLSAVGSAHAGAYALAANNIQGFTISTGLGGTDGITFGPSIDSCSNLATLNGVTSAPSGGPGVSDCLIATVGTPIVTNNASLPPGVAITPVGPTITNYVYADSVIRHPSGAPFDAAAIAEGHLQTSGAANGNAANSSATGFTADFTVVTSTSIDFSFTADPIINLFLQANLRPGSFSQGVLGASLTISCQSASCGGAGVTVFSWAPNGTVSSAGGVTGTVGGIELADAENLNLTLTRFTAGGSTYSGGSAFGLFHAVTGDLATGDYTLSLAMNASNALVKIVPEPGSILLVALGLIGAGVAGRRNKMR